MSDVYTDWSTLTAKGKVGAPAGWQAPGFDDTAWTSYPLATSNFGGPPLFIPCDLPAPGMVARSHLPSDAMQFRIHVPGLVSSANVEIFADDGYTMWVNGEMVGSRPTIGRQVDVIEVPPAIWELRDADQQVIAIDWFNFAGTCADLDVRIVTLGGWIIGMIG